jgi:hypothetical protein
MTLKRLYDQTFYDQSIEGLARGLSRFVHDRARFAEPFADALVLTLDHNFLIKAGIPQRRRSRQRSNDPPAAESA